MTPEPLVMLDAPTSSVCWSTGQLDGDGHHWCPFEPVVAGGRGAVIVLLDVIPVLATPRTERSAAL